MPDATSSLDCEQLYRAHGHVVLRRARAILNDDSEAQEILQDVFLSLLNRPAQFSGRSSITTFLYRMTTNQCLTKLRNRRNRSALWAKNPRRTSDPSVSQEQLEASEVLARLPARLANVAIYYYVDEMSQDEIADILGCSRRMVGKLIAKLHTHTEKVSI